MYEKYIFPQVILAQYWNNTDKSFALAIFNHFNNIFRHLKTNIALAIRVQMTKNISNYVIILWTI